MSKPSARQPAAPSSRLQNISIPRTAISALLIVLGIVWMAVYINLAQEASEFVKFPGAKAPSNPLPWMADLGSWNFAIGFGLIFIGLASAANRGTPLGQGRGVVIGMLGCFLIGLVWIVTFYFVGSNAGIPVMQDLNQYNLLVGIGFMAVGFTFATKWE